MAPPSAAPLMDRAVRSLALWFRRRGERRTVLEPEAVLAAARAGMKQSRYCLLATHGAEAIHARVLQPFHPDEDFRVWLGTSPRSRKVAELRADPHATLAYTPGASCVVLEGEVQVVEELALRRRCFMRTWWAFFPGGPDGDDFVLLRFVPRSIEVWDARRGITPPPFGLRSARLVREGGDWRLSLEVAPR